MTERFNVKPNSVEQLKAAIALQPVTAAVQGYTDVFLHYKHGIFDSPRCGTELDHGVVLVGFGTDSHSGDEYWILRNDWGISWGESGYMRLKMQDGEGICGVNMAASYASVSMSSDERAKETTKKAAKTSMGVPPGAKIPKKNSY